MKEGFKNGAKMAAKVNNKVKEILDSKNHSFGSQNCAKMDPKLRAKSKNFVDISGYPPKTPTRRPNGCQGAPKWSQNGAQREPNGEKMEVHASQNWSNNQ